MSRTGDSVMVAVPSSGGIRSEASASVYSRTKNNRPPPLPASLGFLKDAIREVVFANYFLSRYEAELRELSPREWTELPEPSGPETPAQRARRLLLISADLERRVQEDTARVGPALERLSATGVAALEESVFKMRGVLVEEVIAPNLHVLKLEQDGGVQSPFQKMEASEVVEWLLHEQRHDEARMHQAERMLRSCAAVQRLQSDLKRLTALKSEANSVSALENAASALEEARRFWDIQDPESDDAGPFSTHLRHLAVLQADLARRRERLENLRPKFEAYGDAAGTRLSAKVETVLPGMLRDWHSNGEADGETLSPAQRVTHFFMPGTPLARLAEIYGILPTAQAVRDAIAKIIDERSREDGEESRGEGTLDRIPAEIGRFISERVRDVMATDPEVKAILMGRAVALCNRGLGEDLAGIARRLERIPELRNRRIHNWAETVENIEEIISRIETQARSAPIQSERGNIRSPVVMLLAGLGNVVKEQDALVESTELDALFGSAFDYVRRRTAFLEQVAKREEYVRRGWTAASRQKRMEKAIQSDVPTTLELGRMDAQLGEMFDALQNSADAFLTAEERPGSTILNVLLNLDRGIKESLAGAPGVLRGKLLDPEQSPVLVDTLKLMERLRASEAGNTARVETLDVLLEEIHAIVRRGGFCVVPSEAEPVMTLCRTAGVSSVELSGFRIGPDDVLPIGRYLGEEASQS